MNNNNNNKGSRRSNNKKSLYEKSMKMVSNILKLSSFSIAKMTLGGTPSLKTTPPPPSPLSQLPGTQMAREPSNSSMPVSYVTEPFEGNDGSSLHVIHEENGIDGDASKYIKRVHDKYRYDSSEGSTLSPKIFPPPPRRGHRVDFDGGGVGIGVEYGEDDKRFRFSLNDEFVIGNQDDGFGAKKRAWWSDDSMALIYITDEFDEF
ncbi:hypothetical protein CsSME_00006845 [Camellia sinensis var. sinensis]